MQEVKDVNSFGCCAYWQVCNLGIETCVYAVSNPAKQQACGAYKRASRTTSCVQIHEKIEVVQPSSPLIKSLDFDNDEDGQLTLF